MDFKECNKVKLKSFKKGLKEPITYKSNYI